MTEHQYNAGGLVHRSSTLSVSAVHQSHSGNFTCTVHSESGVGAATAQLKVLGKLPRKKIDMEKKKTKCDCISK